MKIKIDTEASSAIITLFKSGWSTERIVKLLGYRLETVEQIIRNKMNGIIP